MGIKVKHGGKKFKSDKLVSANQLILSSSLKFTLTETRSFLLQRMMHNDMKLYRDRLHYTTITTTSFNRHAVTGKEFVSVALVNSESRHV